MQKELNKQIVDSKLTLTVAHLIPYGFLLLYSPLVTSAPHVVVLHKLENVKMRFCNASIFSLGSQRTLMKLIAQINVF